jgi:hypothetical protein
MGILARRASIAIFRKTWRLSREPLTNDWIELDARNT